MIESRGISSYRGAGTGSVLKYFFTGTALGVVMGLMFAPRSGEEIRESMGDWVKDKREKGRSVLSGQEGKEEEESGYQGSYQSGQESTGSEA